MIEKAKTFLAQKKELTELQVKQLEAILYAAANDPALVEALVKERIAAETAQTEKLFGYQFTLDGKKVNTNDLDEILKSEKDLAKRRKAWEASKEVGKGLRTQLGEIQDYKTEQIFKPWGIKIIFIIRFQNMA